MRDSRRGATILETMLAVSMVSIIASMAVTLIHLAHRTYESVEKDNQENRELLRFANRFREAAHGSSIVDVTEDGRALSLKNSDSKLMTTFVVADAEITMQRTAGETVLQRDSFALHGPKRSAKLDSMTDANASQQRASEWSFFYDANKQLVGASRNGERSVTLSAALNLYDIPETGETGEETDG